MQQMKLYLIQVICLYFRIQKVYRKLNHFLKTKLQGYFHQHNKSLYTKRIKNSPRPKSEAYLLVTHCADKKWWQEYTAMPIAIPTCWGWCLDEGTEEEEEEGGLFPNHCATITPGECRTSELPTGEDLTMSWEWCMLGYAWEWWLLPGNIEGYVEVGSPLLEDQGSGVLCPGPSKNRTENPIIDA